MGNLSSVTSCVECIDDNSFPRPASPNIDSSMQALPPNSPPNSTNGGTSFEIPITTQTTEDIVLISTSKPLGITLRDSDTVKGVFVTAIKEDGNVGKLKATHPIAVGMMLVELNGVNVTCESLESVIGKISASPEGKRMVLQFRGTKPVAAENSDTSAPSTATATATASTTSTSPPPIADTLTSTTTDDVATDSNAATTVEVSSDAPEEEDKSEEEQGGADSTHIPQEDEKVVEVPTLPTTEESEEMVEERVAGEVETVNEKEQAQKEETRMRTPGM